MNLINNVASIVTLILAILQLLHSYKKHSKEIDKNNIIISKDVKESVIRLKKYIILRKVERILPLILCCMCIYVLIIIMLNTITQNKYSLISFLIDFIFIEFLIIFNIIMDKILFKHTDIQLEVDVIEELYDRNSKETLTDEHNI